MQYEPPTILDKVNKAMIAGFSRRIPFIFVNINYLRVRFFTAVTVAGRSALGQHLGSLGQVLQLKKNLHNRVIKNCHATYAKI
jgi:hypothetical protein